MYSGKHPGCTRSFSRIGKLALHQRDNGHVEGGEIGRRRSRRLRRLESLSSSLAATGGDVSSVENIAKKMSVDWLPKRDPHRQKHHLR